MNTFKSSIIAFILLLTIIATILILKPGKEEEGKKEKAQLTILAIPPESIQAFSLIKDKQKITITRKENASEESKLGEWEITEPIQSKVDANLIEYFFKHMPNLKAKRWVSDGKDASVDYGFKNPSLRLIIQTQSSKQPQEIEILIGKKSNFAQEYFAKLKHKPTIYMVGLNLKQRFSHPLSSYRKREILSYSWKKVEYLSVKTPQFTWRIEKDPSQSQWTLYSGSQKGLPAQKKKVEKLLKGLRRLRADEFLADGISQKEIETFGLKKPAGRLIFRETPNPDQTDNPGEELLISKRKTVKPPNGSGDSPIEQVNVMLLGESSIYAVNSHFLQNIEKDPAFFISAED